MHSDTLPITGPCPIDLDAIGFDRGSAVSHCTHCSKNVTNLSTMSRTEARAFMRLNKGQTMCVSYARDQEGRIRFRPEPEATVIPASRLSRRVAGRGGRAAGLAMALGIGAAMAACTPHAEAPAERDVVVEVQRPTPPEPIVVERDVEPIPTAGVAVIPEEIMMDGEMEIPDPDVVDIDTPCDGKKGPTAAGEAERVQTARQTRDAKRPGMQVL